MFILTLTFSLFARRKKTPRDKIQFYDLIFIGVSIILCYYMLTNYKELVWRAGAANHMDVFLGVVLVLLTLEATRRAVGLTLMLVAVFFLLYALVFGPYMPGRFSHGTFSIKRVAYYLYLTDAGIFGTPLGVSASFVYLFILFGAILNKTGAGKFFIDFATALTGYTRGGLAKAAIFPALFYYFALFMAVDFKAAKIGLRGLSRDRLPNLLNTLKTGWILLAPIFALIYLLIQGCSPQKSVVLSILVLIIVSMFSKKTRLTPKKFLEAITEAGVSTTTVAVACAAAGIIVRITTMSGLGLKFTGIVFEVSRGILPIALILASLASLVLGMGIPTTANYIIMATLIAPALIRLMAEGTHLILPHMFVFYYGILADITPPVMLAVFAGAAIAKAPAMKVGIESTKLAIPGYTLPFMFIFHPELISWNFTPNLNLFKLGFFLLLAAAMSIGIAGGMQGYLIREMAGSIMIIPANYIINFAGLALIAVVLVSQILFKHQKTVVLSE